MSFEVSKTESEKPVVAPVERPQSEQMAETLEVSEESKTGLSNTERLEAREFSKENSRAARKRLAEELINIRHRNRVYLPNIKAEEDQKIAEKQEQIGQERAVREEEIGVLEQELLDITREREEWVRLSGELDEVQSALEKAKSKALERFLNLFTKKIDGLRAEVQSRSASLPPEVSEYAVPHATEKHERATNWDERVRRMEDQEIQKMIDSGVVIDDAWVQKSKARIAEFYAKNFELKKEVEQSPNERDVAENCRQHNMVLMHGFSIHGNNHGDNNPSLNTRSFSGVEGALLMAALEPAVSTSSKSLDAEQSAQFPRQEIYSSTGFILAGGEITSAYSRDAGTYAHDLDSRFPKYDQSAVSDHQKGIVTSLDKAINSQDRKFLEQDSYNEISVKHPKIAALCIHDEEGVFGNRDITDVDPEKDPDGYYYLEGQNKHDQKVLEKMLSLAGRMGLPLILTKKSGEMVNLLEGSKPVILDDLLDNPITYSPEERMAFLEEANVGEKMREATGDKTKKQIDAKLAKFREEFGETEPVMEERKQRNKALAAAQLRLMNA